MGCKRKGEWCRACETLGSTLFAQDEGLQQAQQEAVVPPSAVLEEEMKQHDREQIAVVRVRSSRVVRRNHVFVWIEGRFYVYSLRHLIVWRM